jgi:GNAT superfamily N-acetyltransferase
MIEIRTLNEHDLKEAIKLKMLCWPEELADVVEDTLDFDEEYSFWLQWMQTAEEHQDVRTLIGAFENDQMLGVAFASFAEEEDVPVGGMELNGLWVYPNQRGRNIALILIQTLLQKYIPLGIQSMVVYNPHFAPSNTFFLFLGGRIVRKDAQMDGYLLVDIFLFDVEDLANRIDQKLSKQYIKPMFH